MGKITQKSSKAPEAQNNSKAFILGAPTSARQRKHQITKHVKVVMKSKVNEDEQSNDILAKITPGMSKLSGYAPAPNPFKMIEDQKNVMNLPTLNFDTESATHWLEGEISKMTEEGNDFVDFFSKQMKIVQPDGSKVDMNEAMIKKQFMGIESTPMEETLKSGSFGKMTLYDPLEKLNLPKIDFNRVQTLTKQSNMNLQKAKFEINAAAMKTMFEMAVKMDAKIGQEFLLQYHAWYEAALQQGLLPQQYRLQPAFASPIGPYMLPRGPIIRNGDDEQYSGSILHTSDKNILFPSQ